MSDFEQRAYIKMRTALNFSAVDIHTDLVNVHQDSAYAYRTVAKWVSLFKAGRESIEDDPRSGRPVTDFTRRNACLLCSSERQGPS